jgi:hypothetical protein
VHLGTESERSDGQVVVGYGKPWTHIHTSKFADFIAVHAPMLDKWWAGFRAQEEKQHVISSTLLTLLVLPTLRAFRSLVRLGPSSSGLTPRPAKYPHVAMLETYRYARVSWWIVPMWGLGCLAGRLLKAGSCWRRRLGSLLVAPRPLRHQCRTPVGRT